MIALKIRQSDKFKLGSKDFNDLKSAYWKSNLTSNQPSPLFHSIILPGPFKVSIFWPGLVQNVKTLRNI
jgi:hypothetical protein